MTDTPATAPQPSSAYRWLVITRCVGFRQGLAELVRYYFVGMFFNMFLPGGAGGDAVKIYYAVSDHRGQRAELATIVLFDRALAHHVEAHRAVTDETRHVETGAQPLDRVAIHRPVGFADRPQ